MDNQTLKCVYNWLLDLLFPKGLECFLCGDECELNEYGLCQSCTSNIVRAIDGPLEHRIIRYTDGYEFGVVYNETISTAIKRLKYRNAQDTGEFLATFIIIPKEWEIDCIVPVPLHKGRIKKRGFNQSEIIAKRVGELRNIPVRTNLLMRLKNTGTQTKRNASKRENETEQAFVASEECFGKRILLLDDVCTTGSTLRSCAQALKLACASHVYAFAACQTLHSRRDETNSSPFI